MELKRYKGSLTVEQLIIAHKKTKSNATSLYKEAQLLFENKMYARCYFLLCIANEELGKSIFVVSAIVDLIAGKIDWHKFWKKLRNHKSKTGMIEFFENMFVSSDDNLTPWKELEQRIPTLEELKMASLYSDMFQNDFFDPEEIIATVYKGNTIKNLIMDCQSYTKYRPNETTGGIFVSWRRKEELPTGA